MHLWSDIKICLFILMYFVSNKSCLIMKLFMVIEVLIFNSIFISAITSKAHKMMPWGTPGERWRSCLLCFISMFWQTKHNGRVRPLSALSSLVLVVEVDVSHARSFLVYPKPQIQIQLHYLSLHPRSKKPKGKADFRTADESTILRRPGRALRWDAAIF